MDLTYDARLDFDSPCVALENQDSGLVRLIFTFELECTRRLHLSEFRFRIHGGKLPVATFPEIDRVQG